mmetsp:Transcript_7227/g.17622  ORF Transcript_7227/g.17622 Transcript_7227/m.17622 type:complete len:150 (+) Transcript_7227:163-612(+)
MIPRVSTRRDENGWELLRHYSTVPDLKSIETRSKSTAVVAVPRRRKSVAELLLPKRKASISTCFVPKSSSQKNVTWTPVPTQHKRHFSHSLLSTLREELEEEKKSDDDTVGTEELLPRPPRPPRRQNGIVRSLKPKRKDSGSSLIQRIE